MKLLEASSVCKKEIVDNHGSDLGRPESNAEEEELQKLYSWLKVPLTLGASKE